MSTDEEIRNLCLAVLQTKDSDEFENAIGRLRGALNQHALETENMGIHMILNMPKRKTENIETEQETEEKPG